MKKSIGRVVSEKAASRGAPAQPQGDESKQPALKAVAELRAARKGVSLGGLKSRDLIAERRR